jgi:hypothetical protein
MGSRIRHRFQDGRILHNVPVAVPLGRRPREVAARTLPARLMTPPSKNPLNKPMKKMKCDHEAFLQEPVVSLKPYGLLSGRKLPDGSGPMSDRGRFSGYPCLRPVDL